MKKITKTEKEWRKQLSPQAYNVSREHGTEAPFTGEYYDSKVEGIYKCICCDAPLFSSQAKFDSGTGWPSYFEAIDTKAIREYRDQGYGMERVEVLCNTCDAHLGHVFPDGPKPTGLRYCINSVCLTLDKD